MEHGNMLAIVGSPGSGKTTLAVKLAAEIAKKKKNVVVVCSDPFVPSVPFLLPMDMEQEVSLGALLTAPALTQNKILEACVSVPANEYISLLGYRMGENLMSYPKVTRERAVEFLVCLRHLADYVIWTVLLSLKRMCFPSLPWRWQTGYCVWELPICGEYPTSSPMWVCWKDGQTMENI